MASPRECAIRGDVSATTGADVALSFGYRPDERSNSHRHLAASQGIGKQLWAESLAFARQCAYRKALISVLAHNNQALRFYRSLGFADIGVAREHVQLNGTFYDEIFLERAI